MMVQLMVIMVMIRQLCHDFGHGVSAVAQLPIDTIANGSVEKDGGENDSIIKFVEVEVDQVNFRVTNGHGLPPVPPLDSEIYSRTIAGGDNRGGKDEAERSELVEVIAGDAVGAVWILWAGCGWSAFLSWI